MKNKRFQTYTFIIIPLLFLLYSAPSALDYVFHFPDEKYYTDSVLHMMEKNDCFTPYQADGTPRFKKPIITYWVLLGSYKLFGVSVISSRLFFWLAGALLVFVTYFMGWSLSGNRKIAAITAFITAANPLVLLSASRSIPDILLTLFLTISAWGFVKILISEKVKNKYYWMAYLAAALAFETKGLPAAAFAGISMLFLLFNPWKKIKLSQLLKPVSLLVSLAVAFSWFVIMYVEHGAVYLDSFFADQVGERVSSKSSQFFGNTGLGFVNLIAFLIPWIIIFFSKPQKLLSFIKNSHIKNKAVFGFIGTWIIVIILMAGSVFKFYDRYLLPVIPLVSYLFAVVFVQSETRFKKSTRNIFVTTAILFFLINAGYGLFIYSHKILWLGILFSCTILMLYFGKIFKRLNTEIIIANAFMLFFFNAFILMYVLLMPNPGKQLLNNLKNEGISEKDKIFVYGNIRTASNLRIQSKNSLQVISMDTLYELPGTPDHFLVINEKEKDSLQLSSYKIIKGSEEWSAVRADKFPAFMQTGIQKIKQKGTKYLIAKPNK